MTCTAHPVLPARCHQHARDRGGPRWAGWCSDLRRVLVADSRGTRTHTSAPRMWRRLLCAPSRRCRTRAACHGGGGIWRCVLAGLCRHRGRIARLGRVCRSRGMGAVACSPAPDM